MIVRIQDKRGARAVEAHDGDSVLDTCQRAGAHVEAPCGGAGTCGRCWVAIVEDAGAGNPQAHDADGSGKRYCLACSTPAAPDMLVIVEDDDDDAMDVLESGEAAAFAADSGAHGLGMAVDIGTTTLVAHLHDLSSGERLATTSRPNPQRVFGGDCISRISASVDGKLVQMEDVLCDCLAEMRDELVRSAQRPERELSSTVLVGNTVMQHIAAGLAPNSIGVSPFEPLSLFGNKRTIKRLGSCYLGRCIAGYVGADIVAGLVSRDFPSEGTRLFADIGTNGEMALARNGRIFCCATAAGPVFEGAGIRFGMPALPGAICTVSVRGGSLDTTTVGSSEARGVCGTGLIDAVACMLELGVLDESGLILEQDELDAAQAGFVGTEDEERVFYLTQEHDVYITQADVRNVQLAKAAVCAGILTMLDTAGIGCDDIDTLEVAGGFGSHLDMRSAARIGLFPKELERVAKSVGNAAGEGASALLVSSAARERELAVAQACEYLELSGSATFNNLYIEQMEF